MGIRFNMKGLICGVILLVLVLSGFVIIPGMFMQSSKPVDYTILRREAIPDKILDIMGKYSNEERALVAKLGDKIYIIVTKEEKKRGIDLEKIEKLKEEDKSVIKVKVKYKNKSDAMPYLVVQTNLHSLPDRVELDIIH